MRRPLLLLVSVAVLASWTASRALSIPQDPAGPRAQELAELARDLAERGETRQALSLVQAELVPGLPAPDRATLLVTVGWLELRLAEREAAQRAAHLEAARDAYAQALALAPGDTRAQAGLALVEGDVALDAGDQDAALAAYRRAIELDPEGSEAGARMLALLGSDSVALAEEARTLEAGGHKELALEAWRRALVATPPEGQGEPALRWMLLAGELDRFDRASVDALEGEGPAVAELRRFAEDPLQAPPPSWASSPLGRHAVAVGLGSLSGDALDAGENEIGARLLERAVELAPDPPIEDRAPARRTLSIRLGEHLLAHPELDPNRSRLKRAIAPLLATPPAALDADRERAFAAHALLGRALVALEDPTKTGPGSARFHLARALELARADEPGAYPEPELALLYAGVLERAGESAAAVDAYLDAALGFIEHGDRAQALAALERARALDLTLGGSPRIREVEALLGIAPATPVAEEALEPVAPVVPPAPERSFREVDGVLARIFGVGGAWNRATTADVFAPSTWYAGGGLGVAHLADKEGDVEDELEDLAYTVGVDLDGTTTAWRIYGGYRFSLPLAIEIGYADHGQIDSTVGPEPADLDQFLDDLSDTHPATAAGPTAALRALLIGNDYLALTAHVGVWYWEADVDVTTTTASATIDRDGTDLFYGVGLAWYPVRWGGLRADLERYDHGDDATDVATLGLEIDLGRVLGGRGD